MERMPHTKSTPEDPRVFYDEFLPLSPTPSEIDELDQLLQEELFNNVFYARPHLPTM